MPAMTRRPDPLRIYAARRAGLLTRIQAELGISESTAEGLHHGLGGGGTSAWPGRAHNGLVGSRLELAS